MLQVFITEYGFLHRYAPVDTKGSILDVDATIGFRVIELVALVLEDGGLGEHCEAVCEATRDEELETDD